MKWHRVLPTIRFGTVRYPEKVARRLRVVNATAFALVAISLGFVVAHMINPNPGLWPPSLVHLGAALGFSAVPLMHRWGPSLGASLLIAVGLADISGLCLIFGTGSGLHFWALLVPALLIPFYGEIRLPVAVALVALAATVTIVLEAVTPVNTGLRPPHQVFVANFIPSVVLSFAILFAIVLYAMRQIAHAEAAAEHEFERSEALIANILPVSVAARLKESGGEVIADRYDHQFRNGREFAAWLGLTPANKSSGGKEKLGRITKMGDQYLRSLLVVGMTSLVRQTRSHPERASKWLTSLLERKAARVATVAMANKTARIVWAVLTRNETYGPRAAV